MKLNEMSANLIDIKSMKGLKLLHVNIRSMLAHWEEVESTFLDGSLDVVAFTETWLHANCDDNLFHVNGFNFFRLDRRTVTHSGLTKRGGGICVFVKNNIDVLQWPKLEVSNSDIETMSLSCKRGNHKRLNVTVVYRPPTGNINSAIDTVSDNILEIRGSVSGNSIIFGDFNIDLLTNNVQSKRLEQFANFCNVEQLIQGPTRIAAVSET